MITPHKAQAMLDNTLPTPWAVGTEEYTYSTAFTDETTVEIRMDNGDDPICSEIVLPDELPRYQATFELMASAPDMAKQIANMHYEYAVQVLAPTGQWQTYAGWQWQAGGDYDMVLVSPDDPQGWSSDYQAVCDAASEAAADHTRIVRRLVADPEVID